MARQGAPLTYWLHCCRLKGPEYLAAQECKGTSRFSRLTLPCGIR